MIDHTEDAECTALLAPLGFRVEGMGGNLVGYVRGADGEHQTIVYAAEEIGEILPTSNQPIRVFVCRPDDDGNPEETTWPSVAAYASSLQARR